MKEEILESAYGFTRARLLKYIFLGGCPRDMGIACAIGWNIDSAGKCVPPPDYDGLCGPMYLSGLPLSRIEEYALKCRLHYPCKQPCAKNFNGCPQDWNGIEGICFAAAYSGQCSPTQDFRKMSFEQKAEWSVTCQADWPCDTDAVTISTQASNKTRGAA